MSDTPGWSAPGSDDSGRSGWDSPAGAPGEPVAPPPGGGWEMPGEGQKPGVIPLRPLGVGEILDGALATMRTHPKVTLGFSALVAAATQVVLFFTMQWATAQPIDEETGAGIGRALLGGGVGVVVEWVGGLVLAGILTVVIGQAVLGRPTSIGEAWQAVRPRIFGLVGVALLAGIIVLGGTLLCVLPGIFFYVALSLATPALVLEGQPITRSLRRSMDLVRGAWWRTFWILVLAAIVSMVLTWIIALAMLAIFGMGSAPLLGAGEPGEFSTSVLAGQALANALATTIVGPFTAGVTALVYVDRRMRREGLDVTLAQAARQPLAG